LFVALSTGRSIALIDLIGKRRIRPQSNSAGLPALASGKRRGAPVPVLGAERHVRWREQGSEGRIAVLHLCQGP
jgi:hypothetical protein